MLQSYMYIHVHVLYIYYYYPLFIALPSTVIISLCTSFLYLHIHKNIRNYVYSTLQSKIVCEEGREKHSNNNIIKPETKRNINKQKGNKKIFITLPSPLFPPLSLPSLPSSLFPPLSLPFLPPLSPLSPLPPPPSLPPLPPFSPLSPLPPLSPLSLLSQEAYRSSECCTRVCVK